MTFLRSCRPHRCYYYGLQKKAFALSLLKLLHIALFVCMYVCTAVWNYAAEVLARLLHMSILHIRYSMFVRLPVGRFVGMLVLDNMLRTAGVPSSTLSCNFIHGGVGSIVYAAFSEYFNFKIWHIIFRAFRAQQ